MNNLQRYTKYLIKWVIAALCVAPALGWAHGALDYPPTRAVNCQVTGGYWNPPILDKGCRESAKVFNTDAEKAYPAQQWNEVAHIPLIDNPTLDQVKAIIKDGQICSANDPKKASLDVSLPDWTKTDVTPGQPLTLRLIGTAPHVPSTFYAFTTRAGFNSATDTLKWSDLVPLGQAESLTVAKTTYPPNNPPKISGAWGYFEIVRTIPSGLSGNGLIVSIWVRSDPNGEFFIGCSDVNFKGSGEPSKRYNIGQFIKSDMQALKPGDSVHFRIFGNAGKAGELVDITLPITQANLPPGIWGKELASKVPAADAEIGELENDVVKFNQQDALVNSTFVRREGASQAMAIIEGGGPVPTNPAPPVARITGPTSLKSGQAFSFSGTGSTGSNGPLLYEWAIPGLEGAQNMSTASGKAFPVTESTTFKARLNVRDQENGKTNQAEFAFTVTPTGNGDEYPAWILNGGYNSGSKVTNYGVRFECKQGPAGAWCGQNENEPGKPGSTFWQRAWDTVP